MRSKWSKLTEEGLERFPSHSESENQLYVYTDRGRTKLLHNRGHPCHSRHSQHLQRESDYQIMKKIVNWKLQKLSAQKVKELPIGNCLERNLELKFEIDSQFKIENNFRIKIEDQLTGCLLAAVGLTTAVSPSLAVVIHLERYFGILYII